ncbi:DHH family phosphoesterase [Furfurilactobacillus siliginis]|uniref:DHHA1 domain protein n=1 Tax=Furfurilactobacillus siliginis TaxID=348151 RepID=A0A0R2L1Y8_9LACO|nr:bifunctional oligoribonuclease/PAP phosphatase NrnA [Furfurilactobacillus siliginis]KRN95731.1 DHHA1 domain protein [Furfurilactobacillus siliginis]GEK28007.1 oligoribonuclease [Furfurilactobacillus siliginis]
MTIQAEILTAITEASTIIIHRHQRPDPDALGSQFGFQKVLQAAFPSKNIYAVGDIPTDLGWLGQSDEIGDETYANALVITVDTANTERVDDDRFNQGSKLIKIDHHPNDDAYGDLQWVLPEASSTSELLVDLINDSAGLLKLTRDAAQLFYAGIVGDTGRFLYPATSAHTFAIASQLLALGIDATDVSRHQSELSRGLGYLMGEIFEDITIDANGAAHFMITQKRMQELDLDKSQIQPLVSTPGRLAAVRAWLLFVENEDGTYRVHLRSKGPAINELAKRHNGGGHDLASGANAADQAEVDVMIDELATLMADYK